MEHETLLEALKNKFGTTLEKVAVTKDEKKAFVLIHGERRASSMDIEQYRKIGQFDVEYHGFDRNDNDYLTFREKCRKDVQLIFDKHWLRKSIRKPADPKFH
jgi:hypothetical protein